MVIIVLAVGCGALWLATGIAVTGQLAIPVSCIAELLLRSMQNTRGN
ncbi:hypothetical protein [Escherichia coli]